MNYKKRGYSRHLCMQLTQKCNLKCGHCYLGDARNIDMHPDVPNKLFEFYEHIYSLHFTGAESQFNADGVKQITNALKQNDTRLNSLGFITNGTFINRKFFDNLQELKELQDDCGINILVSNDIFHDKAIEYIGKDKETVYENIYAINNEYGFDINLRPRHSKEELIEFLVPVGRGKLVVPNNKRDNEEVIKYEEQTSKILVTGMEVDVFGNVFPEGYYDNIEAETENYGNILKTPIDKILFERGKEICYDL